ncbi:hypothetical protein [Roseobacter sp. A03A-229]
MTEQSQSRLAPDLFAGAGLGLLLGVILGLAVTPVVAGVVGALTSLLAVFLGIDSRTFETRLPAVNAVRIGAFGFATVVGIGLGLFVRINNPLALHPEIVMAKWNEAFPNNPTLARQMMVYERTAITPKAVSYSEGAPQSPLQQNGGIASGKQAVLFSSELSDFDACSQLDPERLATADATLRVYARPNAPDVVRLVGAELGALPAEDKESGLRIAHGILCKMQIAEGTLSKLDASE